MNKFKMYNEIQAAAVLTCISKNLNLLQSAKFPINLSYFRGRVHRLWFILLTRLYSAGNIVADVTDLISEAEVKEQYEQIIAEEEMRDMWQIFLGDDIKFDQNNYEGYYNIVNKWALLRSLNEKGYDISKFYNAEEDVLTYDGDQSTVRSIIEEYSAEISSLRTTYDNKFCREEIIAGDHTEQLLATFETAPAVGMPFPSSSLTELTNGLLPGTLHCISASSGAGKSVYAVSTICKNFVSEFWSFSENKFVKNPNYNPKNGHALYTHTEMDPYMEVNVRFLACISGVNSKTIRMGSYTKAERDRVLYAGKILSACGIHIVSMPDFTPQTIKEKCTEIAHKYGLGIYVHDYVEITPSLSSYYRNNKEIQRPDQIVLAVMTELKELAEDLKVPVLTFTQTNMTEDQMEFPDASCIAGAKATQNKLDSGAIMLPCSKRTKDTNKGKKAFANSHKNGFSEEETFSNITYLYKARAGEYGGYRLKIFQGVDYGVCRQMDWIVMTNGDLVFNKFDVNKYDLEGWYPRKRIGEDI